MSLKKILKTAWRWAMLVVFGISFFKDLILIGILTVALSLGLSPLIGFGVAGGVSFLLNIIGYAVTA